MQFQSIHPAFIAVISSLVLSACGGGGGSGSAPTAPPPSGNVPPPPAAETITTVGAITGFGSVFVNGVRYDTSSATVTLDDSPGVESDLRVGQVVTLTGSINDDGSSGSADSIDFDDNVEGPVGSIDIANNRLVVLGQTVLVDGSTVFDDNISPASLEGLNPGDFVEVSGLTNADGAVVASRIEKKPAGGEMEIRGKVSSLDSANSTFNINALVVDFSGAMLDNFSGGTISDGDFVEAKGTTLGSNGELIATRVERENPGVGDDDFDGQFQIEGLITRFVSATDFDVAGLPVTTTDQTVFLNGTAADLALNLKVQVEGSRNADGVLVATKVDIRRASNTRIHAPVDSVDAGSDTVVMLGISVRIDAMTQIEDKSDADVRSFSIADISVGDFLEVRGMEDPDNAGGVLASRLEREDPENEVRLRGPVESVSDPSLVILGVTIETNGGTQFEDISDNPISASAFFGAVAPGVIVQANGVVSGTQTIIADEVEFEN